MNRSVPFIDAEAKTASILVQQAKVLVDAGVRELCVVRDLPGRVRLVVPAADEGLADAVEAALEGFARDLSAVLGPRAYDPEQAILALPLQAWRELCEHARVEDVGPLPVHWVDRLVTGAEWTAVPVSARVPGDDSDAAPTRITLYSLKGGVGRSTTCALLARHLGAQGRRVLVVDLDLESPGVSDLLLAPDDYPEFGIVDWFVEDAVGQGDDVLSRLTGQPRWAQDLRGEVLVVPAHGRDAREYVAKLGRVYLDRPAGPGAVPAEPWSRRLLRMFSCLEEQVRPDVVLIDARSGLHDLAATAVTLLGAQVLAFAVDSPATWRAFRFLFEHWVRHGMAERVRNRLTTVAAMVPETDSDRYIAVFREAAWNVYRDTLYDEVPAVDDESDPPDVFSFDLTDQEAPHAPWPVLWNRGLAAGRPIREVADDVLAGSYRAFLERFDPFYDRLLRVER